MKRLLPLLLSALLVACVPAARTDLSGGIGESAARIDHETASIRPLTKDKPEVSPHLDSISAETDKLRQIQAQLKDSESACEKLAKDNARLKDEAARALSAKLNSLIVTFSVLLGLSFVLVWFAGPRGVIAPVACGSVIVALLTVSFAAAHAAWIAGGVGAMLVFALAYYALQHRILRSQVNATPAPN